MWEELGGLAREEPLTILLTTHYLEEADELADRLAIVSRGRIVVEGTPEELKGGLQGEAVIVELADGAGGRRPPRSCARSRRCARSAARRAAPARARRQTAPAPCRRSSPRSTRAASPSRRSRCTGPSLDDVYLHYTGRDFRAEDEAGGWRETSDRPSSTPGSWSGGRRAT